MIMERPPPLRSRVSAVLSRQITIEVFYSVDCAYWGKGYATETAKALLKYGFQELKLDKIVGFAEKENIASLRVLEKAGLKRNGAISGLPEKFNYFNGEPFFEITREEWSKYL